MEFGCWWVRFCKVVGDEYVAFSQLWCSHRSSNGFNRVYRPLWHVSLVLVTLNGRGWSCRMFGLQVFLTGNSFRSSADFQGLPCLERRALAACAWGHRHTGLWFLFPSLFGVLKSSLFYRTTRVRSGFSKVLLTFTLQCRSELRWSSWCSGLAGGHRGRCSSCGADAHLGTEAATYTTCHIWRNPLSLPVCMETFLGTAGLLVTVVLVAEQQMVFFSETAIHIKSARSPPWLILNIVVDLHSEVKVHGRLMASVLCSFKELYHGTNLPKLPSCTVLWKREVCGLWFSLSKCTFFFNAILLQANCW